MKMYRLKIPAGTNALLDEYITVPNTLAGIKMGEWWKTASYDERVDVINTGIETGDYISAWEKVAAQSCTVDPSELKKVIRDLDGGKKVDCK